MKQNFFEKRVAGPPFLSGVLRTLKYNSLLWSLEGGIPKVAHSAPLVHFNR